MCFFEKAISKHQRTSVSHIAKHFTYWQLPIGNYNNVIQVIFLEKEKHWAVISTLNSEKYVVHYYESNSWTQSLFTCTVKIGVLH